MKVEFTELGPIKILIVDDQETNVRLMETLLQAEGYATVAATNGREALTLAEAEKPDLILLDIMMPDMDGFEAVKHLKEDPVTQSIPVIMITALDDQETKIRALESGAEEFLTKPIVRVDLTMRVRNLLRLKKYGDLLSDQKAVLEDLVRIRTAELEASYRDTVLTLVRAAERKDQETGQHIQRVSLYCKLIANAMGLPEQTSEALFHASPMHDIGKIGIPDSVLLKPGPLTPEEWEIMKTHCVLGAQILSTGTSPYIRMGAEIALNHHEHWDGTGYPHALKGTAIPLSARIMQIGDVYDALRSRRPYKLAFSHQKAVEIITTGDGRTRPEQFDPVILALFYQNHSKFNEIFEGNTDVITENTIT